MPTVGETIAGKYRVDRQIGAGGMGTVVAATHLTLGTPVALKFLSDAIKGSANSVERFTREAKACAALRSAHVHHHPGCPRQQQNDPFDAGDAAVDGHQTDRQSGADGYAVVQCNSLAPGHQRLDQ